MIGDYLTEINVTCPTCVVELNKIFDLDIGNDYITFIEDTILTQLRMSKRIGAFRTKRLTFSIAFLASVILHSLILISLKNPKKPKTQSNLSLWRYLLSGALGDTENFDKKVPDSVYLDSKPYVESQGLIQENVPLTTFPRSSRRMRCQRN